MKRLVILFIANLAFLPATARCSGTAQARMFCQSLRLQRAWDQNHQYYLDLTTLGSPLNGELTPEDLFSSGYERSTYIVLVDDWYGDQDDGAMALDIPDSSDANGNGLPDFFEVSQAVNNLTSSGAYDLYYYGTGEVQATWSRSAGASQGICTVQFKPSPYYTWLTFSHVFELSEYTGPLTYTPGSNTVSGIIQLQQTGKPANRLGGSVQFAKSSPDELMLQAGMWTNGAMQSLIFFEDWLFREAPWTTNYYDYGWFEFQDGDPGTAGQDYLFWVLSIDDPNDADGDGIPDFSDDPPGPPRRPLLTLTRGTTNWWLTVHGDPHRLHHIQETTSLASADWQTVISVTLTNDPQTLSLSLATDQSRFWRVLAE